MRVASLVAAVLALASGPVLAANVCDAPPLRCATTMPVGGYCQCTSRGQVQDGTVVDATRGARTNSTAGGCGSNPNAPGCR